VSLSLFVGGLLVVLLGLAHSLLGEWLLLRPLFRRDDLPRLLGSRRFARRTWRFAWHLTTVLMVGPGVVAMVLSLGPLQAQTSWVLRVFAGVFAVCGLGSLASTRGRHFSWYVFLLIAALWWLGGS